MQSSSFVLLLLLGLMLPQHALSQGTDEAEDENQTPSLLAYPAHDHTIRVDGDLSESVWERAPAAGEFTQSVPRPGALPSQDTEVRVLFDHANLYVGIRLFDTSPELITAPLSRRDNWEVHSDWVHVMIDSRFDRRTGFGFSVNPREIQRDLYFHGDTNQEESWDAVWEVATTIDSLGWTAEFRIPLTQLRFDSEGSAIWGFQVMRDLARERERVSWSPWKRSDPGFVSRFGILSGIGAIQAPSRLELVPYVAPRLTHDRDAAGNPLASRNEASAEAGADLRVGLPNALTFSATLNPDFGQVEADPAEVNLSAFETFFAERRPFFTEGMDAFRFGDQRAYSGYAIEDFFYSRRIGRSPQRSFDGSEATHVDAPQQTRILGAAKISGRTPGGWSVGVMDALSAREAARVIRPDGTEAAEVVEPLTNHFVSRARRELRGGTTTVGGFASATHRDLDEDLIPILHREAYVVGADVFHTWQDRAWKVAGHMAVSHVGGEEEALARTQRHPMRYYQRPDASHLSYNPEQISLSGHLATLSMSYSSDWLASVQLKEISPGFEINDLGFQTRADARSLVTFVGRRVETPKGRVRDQFYYVSSYHARNFGGDRILDGGAISAEINFTNHWGVGLRGDYRPSHPDDRLTRGGPLAARPSEAEVSGWLQSDPRRKLRSRASLRYLGDDAGSEEWDAKVRLTYQPTAALRLVLAPQLSRRNRKDQYVLQTADDVIRYVFSDLDQITAAMELRLDWTFSPTLSLQVFAHPFLSAGDFAGFKEFATPGTHEFRRYGEDKGTICRFSNRYFIDPVDERSCPATAPELIDDVFTLQFADPSFNLRSLRTNAVFRWEYRPGSALYIVWQQDRNGSAADGNFQLSRGLDGLFGDPGRHVLLAKLTYRFGS